MGRSFDFDFFFVHCTETLAFIHPPFLSHDRTSNLSSARTTSYTVEWSETGIIDRLNVEKRNLDDDMMVVAMIVGDGRALRPKLEKRRDLMTDGELLCSFIPR